MAYAVPNGIIKILGGIPCDSNYENTLYFNTPEEQKTFFESKQVYTLSAQMYSRVTDGVLRVNMPENIALSCNYLMFNNGIESTKYINKWFYAFINRVEYVADNRYNIYYTIDVIQTWHFNYNLKSCFVDREHTESDELYEHLLDEEIETGEPIVQDIYNYDFSSETKLLIYYYIKGENDKTNYAGTVFNKMYNGMKMWFVEMNADSINSVINTIQQMSGTIFSATVVPASWGATNADGSITVVNEVVNQTITIREQTSLADYTPANKKLFNYPYNYFLCINNVGQKVVLRKELFDKKLDGIFNVFEFEIKGTPSPTPCMIMYPKDYAMVNENYEHSLMFNQFPECPVVTDSYTAWWAQNKNSYVTSMVSSVLSGISNIQGATGQAVLSGGRLLAGDISAASQFASSANSLESSIISSASNVANLIAKKADLKNAPDSLVNASQSANLLTAIQRMGFTIINMVLHKEHLIAADNYFTMYGYSCKRVKVPNRNVRRYFTYTKTVGCKVFTIDYNTVQPAHDALKTIEAIYDNGIRFWNPNFYASVGDYTVNNAVL